MAAVYKSLSKTPRQKKDDDAPRKNKQRVLILSSRGVTYRHRHLLNDLASMMPHGRKETKFDSKSKLYQLNELADLYNCNNILFFEARKAKDLYIWMSKAPNGPTVKMHLQNLHTMEELHFTGNCLKGSRPILSFDAAFDAEPYLGLIRELLFHIFGVPQGARKSKPFIDHVLAFSVADGKIWARNYQINEAERPKGQPPPLPSSEQEPAAARAGGERDTDLGLVEIGPRFVLTPIVIQEGSFGGPIIYENRQFVSPNQVRAQLRRAKAGRHNVRAESEMQRLSKKTELGLRSGVEGIGGGEELNAKKLFA